VGILINNAGVNTRGNFREMKDEEVREMAIVNTYGYTLLTRGLMESFRERGGKGLILTICSSISSGPAAREAVYAASKVFEEYTIRAIS